MAVCKECGKKGIFLSLNEKGLCSSCAQSEVAASNSWNQMRAETDRTLQQQDRDLALCKKAEEQYELDNNPEKLIAAYEGIFINRKSPLLSQSRWFKLVDLYVQTNQNDKAWRWLNTLACDQPDYRGRIDSYRHRILKVGGKHFEDALYFLMTSIAYDLATTYNPTESFESHGRAKFEKGAKPLIKKLSRPAEDLARLGDMLLDSIKGKKFTETSFKKKFKAYLEEGARV